MQDQDQQEAAGGDGVRTGWLGATMSKVFPRRDALRVLGATTASIVSGAFAYALLVPARGTGAAEAAPGRTPVREMEPELFRWSADNLSAQVAADERNAVFIPPRDDPSGSSGCWIRKIADNTLHFAWFRPAADGATNDWSALKAAVDLMRALPGHRLLLAAGKAYYMAALPTEKTNPISVDFSNFLMDGQGATIKLEPMTVNKSLFVVGNSRYLTGKDEKIPTNIVFRNIRFDYIQTGGHTACISLRFPCADVVIEDCEAYQSRHGPATPVPGNDSWFIVLNVRQNSLKGGLDNPENANARLHRVTVRRNVVRDKLQLTAGAGRGIAGLTIIDNRVYNAQANGIAITGTGRNTRLENVLISRNEVHGATGRGIFVMTDAIGGRDYEIASVDHYQNYARDIEISENVLIDCKQGLRLGSYIQGFHGLLVRGNTIRSSTVQGNSGDLMIFPGDFHWKEQYHRGSDPVITERAFDSNENSIKLPAHGLCNGTGVRIKSASDLDIMPGGIASDIPYFVGAVTADSFKLYEGMDPRTGALNGLVEITSNGRGSFTVSHCTIATNVTVENDNIFLGTNVGENRIQDVRSARIGGRFAGRPTALGGLVDVTINASFDKPGTLVAINRGGTRNLLFKGAKFKARSDKAMVLAKFGGNSNYDVVFDNCLIDPEFDSSAGMKGIAPFFTDDTPARRKGPGWSAVSNIIRGANTAGALQAVESWRANRRTWSGNRASKTGN